MGEFNINFNKTVLNPETQCYTQRTILFHKLKEFVVTNASNSDITIILHGSYATGDITSYSDIDLLALYPFSIEKEEHEVISRLLKRIAFYLHRRDPLMHHVVDIIDEDSLAAYDESILPLDTLRKSVLLYGKPHISLSPDEGVSKENARRKLIRICKSLSSYKNSLINRTPYKLKCLVSIVLLVPVLLLQADGRGFRDKKESLKHARLEYAVQLSFEAIDRATHIRNIWRVSGIQKIVRIGLIPLESYNYSPLWLQRASGALFPVENSLIGDFFESSREFATQVLVYAENNIF